MTIETITALKHEHTYDRLNDSNNSNDGREIKRARKTVQTEMVRKDTPRERYKKTGKSKVQTKR